VMKK